MQQVPSGWQSAKEVQQKGQLWSHKLHSFLTSHFCPPPHSLDIHLFYKYFSFSNTCVSFKPGGQHRWARPSPGFHRVCIRRNGIQKQLNWKQMNMGTKRYKLCLQHKRGEKISNCLRKMFLRQCCFNRTSKGLTGNHQIGILGKIYKAYKGRVGERQNTEMCLGSAMGTCRAQEREWNPTF